MPETKSIPALILKMQVFRKTLSKAEQKVVDYIIEQPEEVIRLSVAGLAANCSSSEATVVRTCRRLGLDGYQDLKVTLAQDIVTPLQSIHEEITDAESTKSIIDKIFQSTLHTINFTHSILNVESIEKAVDAIMNAKRIIIIGLGNSHAIALDLYHKLLRLGMDAQAICDSHIQAIATTFLGPDDCLFAISLSGSSRDIIESVKIAKEKKAITISLTDIEPSPLSKVADIKLYTASRETAYRIVGISSRIGQMTIIDTLYTIMATRNPTAVEGFHKIEKSLVCKKNLIK